MSDLPVKFVRSGVITSPKGISNYLSNTKTGAREGAEPDHATAVAKLESQHPAGHNPRPQLTVQMVISRCDSAEDCAAIVADHAGWLPAWESGRAVDDLHNWVSRWEPGAAPPAVSKAQATKRNRNDDLLERLNADYS
jgi:hypothetical protein